MSWSVDDFLDDFEAPTTVVRICPRVDLRDRHAAADRALSDAVGRGSSSLADDGPKQLAAEVRAIEDEIEAATREFRFRALSRRRWRALLAEHHPQKPHKTEGLDFNPETFPVAAIAACAVEPEMTVEEAERLADRIPLGEFERMWGAVLQVNLGVSDAPKSVLATATLRMNGAFSTSAAHGESPEASS